MSQQIPRILNFISKQIISSKKKMHGLNSIASCCVNYEYRCSIFLLGPQTWPTSTRLFLHCNVLLVFLLFSPSLDSGFSHGRLNWKKPVAWKGKCAMFLFSLNKNMLLYVLWLNLTQNDMYSSTILQYKSKIEFYYTAIQM